MKEISIIFIFSSLSKLLVAMVSIVLINYLNVEEYSHYILIFTVFSIVFQVIASVIERLYVSCFLLQVYLFPKKTRNLISSPQLPLSDYL